MTPISAEQPSVMVVEDEQVALRAMSLLLSSCGYRTQAYESAEEALQNLSSGRRPRLALVDFDLPGMNGIDLIQRLAELDPAIVPILITATDPETIRGRLRRPVPYMRKPVNFEKLLSLMGERQSGSGLNSAVFSAD